MASPWDDFWPKLVLTLADKAVLGGIFALATYLLQKKLELFKRDQPLTSEPAKARIAAYHRVFGALSSYEFEATMAWAALILFVKSTGSDNKEHALNVLDKQLDKAFDYSENVRKAIGTEEHFVGSFFCRSASSVAQAIGNSIGEIVSLQGKSARVDTDGVKPNNDTIQKLKQELYGHLPMFAQLPCDDVYFLDPGLGIYQSQMAQAAIENAGSLALRKDGNPTSAEPS